MIYCWTHRRIRPGCCFIKLSAQERHAEMEVIAMPRTCWKDPKAEIKMKVSQNATPIDEKKQPMNCSSHLITISNSLDTLKDL